MPTPRRLAAALAVTLVAVAPGCRRAAPPPEPMRVRLLTVDPISGRWEKAAEQGLGLITASLGADVARLRTSDEATRRRVLDEQGRAGVELVFCIGTGFADLLFTEAPAFPGTAFVLLPGRARAANVAGMVFVLDGAGYLAGALAAAASDGGAVGVQRGEGGPWLEDLEDGFSSGFLARRRGGRVLVAQGADGPWQLVEDGAEVALYSADRADPAVLAAAHDAGLQLVVTEPGLLEADPGVVLAAVRIDVAEAMLRVAREVKDGTFQGRVYAFDQGSGVLDLELGTIPDVDRRIRLREAVEQARAEVTAGYVELEHLGLD